MSPFFSVVIPVYNRAHALGRAARSVLAQSCHDFEIVVVDDGSCDDPAAVVAQLSDSRITFVRKENGGGGSARNFGIDLARGQFIAPLDSDDEFLPGHLERMKQLLESSTGVAGYARVVVDRGNGTTFLKPPRAIRADEHMATYLLCERGFVPTITIAVDTATARRIRYAEHLRFGEDTDFAIRLFLRGCRFEMIEEPGAVWHDLHDTNRTSASRKGARLVPWLEELRPNIPPVAYHGCRGWTVAKGLAPRNKLSAFALYANAVLRGCYRPRLATIIFLQIFLSDALYRHIADHAIGLMSKLKHGCAMRSAKRVGRYADA
ncbi:MAG: glycosyltransferase family 2 protein [Rhizomicrobium sp.]